MKLLKNENVIKLMENVLNRVDPRLVDHGRRVAYLMFRILEPHNIFGDKLLHDICLLAMLHDIGAYKTEEIDKMVMFETNEVRQHSIYGYLFLKHFSPLKELAPIILYHHANCSEINHIDSTLHQFLSQLISLCDRIDVFLLEHGLSDDFLSYIHENRKIKYSDHTVDILLESQINLNSVFNDIDTDTRFNSFFYDMPMSGKDVDDFIKMIVASIDFRSHYTVIHTVSTTCIAGMLAKLLNMNKEDIENIKTGAMLHDIGKVAIPISIVEKDGKLSDMEMAIMKTHVYLTEKVLEGLVDDKIINIATRHHEKLDGSGYPENNDSHNTTLADRIVAVSDIFSALCEPRSYKPAYPKEKVCEILAEMSVKNLLDPRVVTASIKHYDKIMNAIEQESQQFLRAYKSINSQYDGIIKANVEQQNVA